MNEKIFSKAVTLLSRRAYFSSELIKKLNTYDFDKTEILSVIEELKSRRYIDDETTASSYISELQNKKYGKNYIYQKMYQKGISSTNIKTYLASYFDAEKNTENIKTLKDKKLKNPLLDKAKAYNYLKSRGF